VSSVTRLPSGRAKSRGAPTAVTRVGGAFAATSWAGGAPIKLRQPNVAPATAIAAQAAAASHGA